MSLTGFETQFPPSRSSFLIAIVVTAMGAAVLAGWVLDLSVLKSIRPEWETMKANTALCFVLSGAALCFLQFIPGSTVARGMIAVTVGATLTIALLSLRQHVQGEDWGIDHLLVAGFGNVFGDTDAGLMAPGTAMCFVLSSTAMGLLVVRRAERRMVAVVPLLGAVICAFGVLIVVAYTSDVVWKFAWWSNAAIAIHTGVAFVLLGLGIIGVALRRDPAHWSLDRVATLSLIAAITVLLGIGAITYTTLKSFAGTAATVAHTHRIHARLLDLKAALGDAIAAQRAYILSAQPRYMETARTAIGQALAHRADLAGMVAGNAVQQRNLEQADYQLQRLASGITTDSSRQGQRDAARVGQIPYDDLRALLDRMDADEAAQLLLREQQSQKDFALAMRFIPMGTAISVFLLCSVLLTLNREIGARRKTAQSLAAERTLLRTLIDVLPEYIYVKNAQSQFVLCNAASAEGLGVTPAELIGRSDVDFFPPERAAEYRREEIGVLAGTPVIEREESFARRDGVQQTILTTKVPLRDSAGRITGIVGRGRDITERQRASEAIQRLNVELEQRVADRTAELEAANQELEAFSYSVSHDLRAPLRAVDGYSQALVEDFGSRLPMEGRRYLETIRQETHRMGQLIDDLLEFAQLSRHALQKRTVPTDTLVHEVLAELRAQQQGRQIEISIGELRPCLGDRALLKQVWVNLLSNALKYTRRRENARIEIGCQEDKESHTYFVRDNGTGFDMRYAEKLFGVFQRLHRADEFEGTGVGLAIVQRVIQRHGGRVWAEAELDRGATFYFTVPASTAEKPI